MAVLKAGKNSPSTNLPSALFYTGASSKQLKNDHKTPNQFHNVSMRKWQLMMPKYRSSYAIPMFKLIFRYITVLLSSTQKQDSVVFVLKPVQTMIKENKGNQQITIYFSKQYPTYTSILTATTC